MNISISELDGWIDITSFGRPTYAGVPVSESTAIRNPTVFACVKILSEDIASLPLPVYRRLRPRGKEQDPDHPLYAVLHDVANPEMSAFTLRQTLMGHILLWGNAYAEKQFHPITGQVIALWPLRPDRMRVQRAPSGELLYIYRLPNGEEKAFRREQVLHLVGLSMDGVIGLSPIAQARQAIGLSLAGEEFASRFFGNGTHFGGFLKHPKKLSTEAYDRLRDSVNTEHGGLSHALRLKILEEGMDYQEVGMPLKDAQFLESRQFQTLEIAKFYRMQPHKLGDMQNGVSYASIEQQNIDYVTGTLRPWLVCIEQAMNMQLLPPEQRREWKIEHVVEGLLQGDSTARAAFYNQMFQVGAYSPNDILELENRNPVENGDERFVPMNMIPLSQAIQPMPELQEPDDDEGSNESGRKMTPRLEDRAMRSLRGRNRAVQQFHRVFRDAAQRIINREVSDVRKAVKSMLGDRNEQQFLDWLEEFYSDASAVWIARTMMPAFQTFAEAIAAQAADEINLTDDPSQEVQRFAREYDEAFSFRHRQSSHGQLRQLAEEAVAARTDPAPLIEQRLAEWEQKSAQKIASRETIQLSAAVSRMVYGLGGVTSLRWVAQGSDACPYCQELNGRIVGISQNFVREGETYDPTGGKGPMKIRGPISHPPLHQGCVCSISPG